MILIGFSIAPTVSDFVMPGERMVNGSVVNAGRRLSIKIRH